ncbi:MAG: hypothetical protein IPL95_16295 [Saprospiraceae bacterium]|nr:hypothetical protein [Saprospiraceae bacterium]
MRNVNGLLEAIIPRLSNIFREFVRIDNANKTRKVSPVYILTATAGTISETLGKEIYDRLKPPLQYKSDYNEWLPFSESQESIGDILMELSNNGFEFKAIYIPHKPEKKKKVEIMTEINNNVSDVIAIIDLLAIHEGNEDIARKFSDTKIKQVMTPVDTNLDDIVRQYVISIGGKIFEIFESQLFGNDSDMYAPRLPAKFNVVKTLSKVLPPRNVTNKLGTDQIINLKDLSVLIMIVSFYSYKGGVL